MKKVLVIILALAMVFSFAACGDKEAQQETTSKYNEVNPGKLTVATSPDFAPYEFYAIGEDGNPYLAGFDMEMAEYIANELGLELDVIPMDFDGTIMELQAGNVDMSLAGYSITEDRKEIMDFSIVYFSGEQAFVTTKEKAAEMKDLATANDPKYTIEAQVGSIQATLMAENTPNANCIELAKVTDIASELLNDKADGAFMEKVVAESYVKNYPELVILCDVPYETEGTAAGIKKGNTALVEAINAAMEKCISSGELSKFVEHANELASGDIIEGLVE